MKGFERYQLYARDTTCAHFCLEVTRKRLLVIPEADDIWFMSSQHRIGALFAIAKHCAPHVEKPRNLVQSLMMDIARLAML